MSDYVPQQKKSGNYTSLKQITNRHGDKRLALMQRSNIPACVVPPVLSFFAYVVFKLCSCIILLYVSKVICAALFFS
jgi:hypothetical protein